MKRRKEEPGMRALQVPFRSPEGREETVIVKVPDTGEPESEQQQEAEQYVQSLAESGRLDYEGGGGGVMGATHRLKRNPDGTQELERIGFSAI